MKQVFKLSQFLQPAHWFGCSQIVMYFMDFSIVWSTGGDCWYVYVTVNKGAGTVLQGKLDMQGHPYLGDGEGGAGVFLAVAGSLMRE